MDQLIKLSFWFLFQFFLVVGFSYGQILSESDIKRLAEKENQRSKGVDIGEGIISRGCSSRGRTIIFQFEVPEYLQTPENMKEEAIKNIKFSGAANASLGVDCIYALLS